MIFGLRSRKRKRSGITPMMSRGRPSTSSCWPITFGSPPNLVRQYPYASMTVSGPAGVSSSSVNMRPSIGWTPSIGSTRSVTSISSTSSGSPRPVIDDVSGRQRPTS